jgi:stage V sporulation protein R
MKNTRLPAELEAARAEIETFARDYGLDFYPIIYEVLDYRTLYETASYGGFPIRYPHWRFGMEYDQLLKGHVWMGSTIYEMVVNTNPSYAYLLEGNEAVTQKMVMSHVTAHVDFFKNNLWFAHTNRKMLDEMANHAARIQRIIDRYGYEVVEDFIDTCLSLENLIDYHAPYIKRPEAQTAQPIVEDEEVLVAEGLKVDREYMQSYINPPEFLEQQQKRLEDERLKQKRFPENPQKDILLFLLNYAPLERWQHTILEIVRNEAYYFAPQGMTKILNEGWACLVAGSRLFTDRGLLRIEEVVRQRLPVHVGDGDTLRLVYDWASFGQRETVRLRTRRGFELEGSVTHQVMLPDGTWRRLDALQVGETVRVQPGPDLWAEHAVPGAWEKWVPAVPTTIQTEAEAAAFLDHRGLTPESFVCLYDVPEDILHAPKSVVTAFLRVFFDGVGKTSDDGITLSLTTAAMSQTVQLLLLNFGILSSRSEQPDGGGRWKIRVTGRSALVFQEAIGFGVPSKQQKLCRYLETCTGMEGVEGVEGEEWSDEVVAIERGQAAVYDLSVEETHRYAAQGLMNHNSYWHSEIMTQKAIQPSEIISFADLHSGVVATGRGQLNPYKLGLEMLRDIEDRWNKGKFGKEYEDCDDILEKRKWDRQLGLGRQKLFEVRKLYNDVTFIDEFLTPEFVREQKLFAFRYNRDTDVYEISSREFREVKNKLLFQLTNFGQPFIYVEDANYNNRGELYLRHRHEGVDLKMDYARDTMRNLYKLWTRPIYLETVIDERKRLIYYDGREISERRSE